MADDGKDAAAAFNAELTRLASDATPVAVTLTKLEAWCLLVHVQLGLLRQERGPATLIVCDVVDRIATQVTTTPALAEAYRRGWETP